MRVGRVGRRVGDGEVPLPQVPGGPTSHCLLVLQLLAAGFAADAATAAEEQAGCGTGINKWLTGLSFLSTKRVYYMWAIFSENVFIKTLWESTGPI